VSSSEKVLLEVKGLDKSFYATHAANHVSFSVKAGEVVALLGENGAGKSTVIKMLAGVYRPDSGDVYMSGEKLSLENMTREIAFVHQTLGLIEWMTVAENIAQIVGYPRRAGLISPKLMNKKAKEVLEIVGGGIDPEVRVFNLSRTDRSLLAIARALIQKPKILVLDEPTASLPANDVKRLFSVLQDLQATGVGIIYVSHRLDEVYEVADRVVIMRNGSVVADRPVTGLPKSELVNLIVGHEVLDTKLANPSKNIQISLKDFSASGVGPLTLDLYKGEVIAFCGLRGAGQDEIGRALAGVARDRSGSVIAPDGEVIYGTVSEAVKLGIGFSTSNRETEAVAPGMSVKENLFLNPLLWGRRAWKFQALKKERAKSYPHLDKFSVRPRNPDLSLDTLSGGNQQKVILARWFGLDFKVMILEEPTMGVDIGAKADIYGLFNDLTATGTALVIISTDMEEVVRVANRAVVFFQGKPVRVLNKDEISFNSLISLASNLESATNIGRSSE
jgi:ribose transport system ATP-binding protein